MEELIEKLKRAVFDVERTLKTKLTIGERVSYSMGYINGIIGDDEELFNKLVGSILEESIAEEPSGFNVLRDSNGEILKVQIISENVTLKKTNGVWDTL